MPDLTTLSALQERLRNATGPDRKLDADLWEAFDPIFATCRPHWTVKEIEDFTPHHTASVDAALALVEKLLPGWAWQVETPRFRYEELEHGYYACLNNVERALQSRSEQSDPRTFTGIYCKHIWNATAPTAPLAILSALIDALISQPGVSP